MRAALEEFLAGARWFGGKGLAWSVTDVRRAGTLGSTAHDGSPFVGIELVSVGYDGGGSETYQVPVAYYAEPQERLAHALIGSWEVAELGATAHAYDAVHDREVTVLWLRSFDAEAREGDLAFHRLPGHDLDLEAHSAVFAGEQSNSSIAFGEDSLMKVFRKVTPGENPDIVIHEALTAAESSHVARLYGWLEAGADEAGAPLHLAMLQQFLRTASDGWDLALASVRDLLAEADLHADEVGGDFASESHRLGVATGEVHAVLAGTFPVHDHGSADLADLAARMQQRLEGTAAAVPELAPYVEALSATFAAVAAIGDPVPVQRVHGDYHLGQTLRTVAGWKIVDFEGEPAKPLAERAAPDSPWRDVAGMLRSFDYAAHVVAADADPEPDAAGQVAYRAAEWALRNQREFLTGYLGAVRPDEPGDADSPVTPRLAPAERALLEAYQADKAVYETLYEARNRPDWIGIPLGAIARLTARRPAAGTRPAGTAGSDLDPSPATDREESP